MNFYFNVKHTIWLNGYQNGNHIEPSELWLRSNIIVTSQKPNYQLKFKY